jgi:23S rRNA G2445 N2-methylase RlmL
MVLLSEPTDSPVFLNPACGSGTLLIERVMLPHGVRIIGCNSSREAVTCAQRNIAVARVDTRVATH